MPGLDHPGVLVGVAALAAASLGACAPATPRTPVVTAVLEPPSPPPGFDPLTPEERLLALLTADNPRIERVAMSLARMGDERVRREAGRRLAALAREVTQEDWRPEDAVLGGTDRAFERQRTAALAPLLAAMSHVGGPAVVAVGFAIAENDAAPVDRRQLALKLLDFTIALEDRAQRHRREAILARLPRPVHVSGPMEVAAFMKHAAKGCFERALAQDPSLVGAQVRLTIAVTEDGTASSTAEGSAPEELRRCLVAVADRFQASGWPDHPNTVTIPFNFIKQ